MLERWEQLLIDSLVDVPDDAWVLGGEDRKNDIQLRHAVHQPHRLRQRTETSPHATARYVDHHAPRRRHAHRELMTAGGLRKPEHLVTSLRHIPTMDAPEHRRRILGEAREVR